MYLEAWLLVQANTLEGKDQQWKVIKHSLSFYALKWFLFIEAQSTPPE